MGKCLNDPHNQRFSIFARTFMPSEETTDELTAINFVHFTSLPALDGD
jgi:hypothetical protein